MRWERRALASLRAGRGQRGPFLAAAVAFAGRVSDGSPTGRPAAGATARRARHRRTRAASRGCTCAERVWCDRTRGGGNRAQSLATLRASATGGLRAREWYDALRGLRVCGSARLRRSRRGAAGAARDQARSAARRGRADACAHCSARHALRLRWAVAKRTQFALAHATLRGDRHGAGRSGERRASAPAADVLFFAASAVDSLTPAARCARSPPAGQQLRRAAS